MNKSSVAFLTCLLCLSVQAADSSAAPTLSFPLIDPKGCPGEMCNTSGQEFIARQDTVARTSHAPSAPAAYHIRKGERLHVIGGIVITYKPTILRANKSCELAEGIRAQTGDLAYVLWSLGEGFSRAWHRGKYFDIDGYGPEGCTTIVSDHMEYLWWVRVENVAGVTGWVSGDEFYDQGRYASHVPEAEWIVLRRGESKLGYTFARDGRFMHRDRLLDSDLGETTTKVLVSAPPPLLVVVCRRFQTDETCMLEADEVYDGFSSWKGYLGHLAGVDRLWPTMARFIGADYMVLYHNPTSGLMDLQDGSLHIVDLNTGKPTAVPIALAGDRERQHIDMDSWRVTEGGFLVNAYVGCEGYPPDCDMLYTRAYRVHINPRTQKSSVVNNHRLSKGKDPAAGGGVGELNSGDMVADTGMQTPTSNINHVAFVKVAVSLEEGSSPITVDAGHAWIEIMELSSGQTITFGTWGNKAPQGLHKNLELGRASIVSRSKFITQAEYDALAKLIKEYAGKGESAWSPINNNCTEFAKASWETVSGENITTYFIKDMGFARPIVPNPISFMYSLIDLNNGYSDETLNKCNSSFCASTCPTYASNCK